MKPCKCVFSISSGKFKHVKSRMTSKTHRSKKLWYSSFVVCENVWFVVVKDEFRTCDKSKMDLFVKIVCSLNLVTILTKSSILRSMTACLVCFGYFFKFTFSIDLLFLLKINWTSTLHINVCPRFTLETLHYKWDLSKFDNKDTTTMPVISFENSG